MDLKGRYILVTGAAKRIGAAIARNLAAAGANVAVHCNASADAARALAAELRAGGSDAFAIQADLAHPETLDFETGELKKVEKAEGAVQ